MNLKRLFNQPIKGIIFGSALIGAFIMAPAVIVFQYFYPGSDPAIIYALCGMFLGCLTSMAKMRWYWDWSDQAISKFFGVFRYHRNGQE